ncbi:hypothetical protein HW555_009688 [Spodoptera exigua]|uniref:C2H2-type domain-containing protein n=1 Tax=Spodoptera exigua TaxID=7107 RepID=A0A835GCK2_SPOEX|nr:hypothetical protein HW555_009688 [Spodoptera exigua]
MGDLCTACMCAGRNLFCIGETGFYHLYSQILNEIQVYDASSFYLKVCWECLARLRRWHHFKERAKQSYTQLRYVHQNNFEPPSPSPSTLQTSEIQNFSCPELVVKDEVDEGQTLKGEDIKTEETHCEPATFVNIIEPRRRKAVKKDTKPIKDKSKKKLKTKSTLPVKKKVKLKKNRSPTPLSIEDDVADSSHPLEDDLEDVPVQNTGEDDKKQVPFVDENTRLNGESKPCRNELQTTPERPQCPECGKSFSSKKTYRYHLNVLHKGQNRYPCPRCGKVYQWKSNLGRHLRTHKARDSGELYCETCDKRFASVATYRQHLRVSRRHVPESDFSFMCNECGKKFVNKTRLRDHIDWEHLHNIKFRCQPCNKPFKCHTSLYVHMQNVHRNKEKKDNLCHVCGKSYQNAAKLKYHIVAMHTSETPYQCTQCSAAFGWYSSLYRHVREVHYKMKVQPKKSKKTKKLDILPSLLTSQVLPPVHQPGPP